MKTTIIIQAIVYAIERCAQFNLDRRYNRQRITILTVKLSFIKQSASFNEHISKIVWDCLEKLNRSKAIRLTSAGS